MACYCASRQLGHPSRLGCGRGWPHDRQPGACCGPGCGRQRAPCPRSGRHAGSRRAQPPRDSLRLNRGGAASVQVFLVSSADGGRSWSERRNLTAALKANPAPEAFVMPGPPGGVRLQTNGRGQTSWAVGGRGQRQEGRQRGCRTSEEARVLHEEASGSAEMLPTQCPFGPGPCRLKASQQA